MIFSLIMATLGRTIEVSDFIVGLLRSDFDLSRVELIIVDQNKDISLERIINSYSNKIKILHIKSDKLGLSYNRNLGVKYASGEILAFPDDDCCYTINTLSKVYSYYLKNKSVCLGRVCDIVSGKDILRKWQKSSYLYASKFDLCYRVSSIAMFVPRAILPSFDEQFGVGAKYGSCEDVDILLTLFESGNKLIYNPNIIVLHPDIPPAIDKLYKYSIGWGALYRKHISFSMATLWIAVLFYHMLKLPMLIGKPNKFKNKFKFICGQIRGFVSYNEK